MNRFLTGLMVINQAIVTMFAVDSVEWLQVFQEVFFRSNIRFKKIKANTMKRLKISKTGLIAASFYLLAGVGLFIFHLYSVKTNVGDSGESAIPVFMLSLPWVMLIPESWIHTELWVWMAYPVLLFCIGINAVLIYGVCALIVFIMSWLMRKISARIRHFTFPKQK